MFLSILVMFISLMGLNLSYYFWIWSKAEFLFVLYPDLEKIIGYTTFDDINKVIHVSIRSGSDYHEFDIYKYINGTLTLVERTADTESYRKVYKLINNELTLVKISESEMQ